MPSTSPRPSGAVARVRGSNRVVFVGLLVVAVVAVAAVTSARRSAGDPFDPASTSSTGTKGLVEVLRRFTEVEVTASPPGPSIDSAIVFRDVFDRDDAARLDRWIVDGGTLVVAGPSPLAAPRAGSVPAGSSLLDCDAGLASTLGGGSVTIEIEDAAGALSSSAGNSECRVDASVVIASRPRGAGRITTVAAAELFTNGHLDEADNAVVAVNLLMAGDAARIAVLVPDVAASVGAGDDGLIDLVPDPVRAAMWQLVLAFVVVVVWRARRLGRPVLEPQAVSIESSELTEAVARMLAANRRPARAAALLRDRARTQHSGALGIALDAPARAVVDALVARTSLSADEATTAVASTVHSDDDLVVVASLLDRIREELAHGVRHP